jgi:hypothetical protein
MTTISLEKENPTLDALVKMAADGTIIVTYGNRVFAFMPVDEEDVQSWRLGENPEFLALMRHSWERMQAEGSVPLEETRRRLLTDG